MKRREFLRNLGTGIVGAAACGARIPDASAARTASSEPFLLSSHGCGRASGYAETNKIVTLDGKTHVAWIDSQGKVFHIRVRTLDRKTGKWSPTVTVGRAHDNHGGPALAVDGKGYLHIVYYPHHHPFRHRRSVRPNDASEWSEEVRFGKRCTYPTLVVGPDDTLYLTCRESDKAKPWVVNLYTKKPSGKWQGPSAVIRADGPKYSHFQEALAWGPDHRTLHLSTRMYGGGRPHLIGYMQSADFGKTWRGFDGGKIDLPATSDTIDVISQERGKADLGHRCGSIAVDAKGVPHVLYSRSKPHPPDVWIASPDRSGKWESRSLTPHIAKILPGWFGAMTGGMTFGAQGRLFVTLTATPLEVLADPKYTGWGSPEHEIIRLESRDDGKSFTGKIVSKPDPTRSHWLPNIERPTGFNRVGNPGLIYTAGPPGKKNTQVISNGVFWVG